MRNSTIDFSVPIPSYFLHLFLFLRNELALDRKGLPRQHCSWSQLLRVGTEWGFCKRVPGTPPPCQQSFTLWLIWSYSGSPHKKWVRGVCIWETNVFLEILRFHPVLIWSFGLWRAWQTTFLASSVTQRDQFWATVNDTRLIQTYLCLSYFWSPHAPTAQWLPMLFPLHSSVKATRTSRNFSRTTHPPYQSSDMRSQLSLHLLMWFLYLYWQSLNTSSWMMRS